ncbi:MAG: FIST signal transduction protein [Prochlorothrix sp.]|nr:FIST N-terminal domain-containing protein [Prochlorothrix sp.]
MNQGIQWSNALSTQPSLEAALQEVVDRAQAELSGSPDLGIVFVSSAFASEYSRVLPLLTQKIQIPHVIGCGGGGIVGQDSQGEVQEMEESPAISLSLACLPGVTIEPFWVEDEQLPDPDSPPQAWSDCLGVAPLSSPEETVYFILLVDPYSSRADELLQGLDFAYPGAVKVGGLASGRPQQREGGLFFQDRYCNEGTIGLALRGNICLKTIVAQGCRPIGSVLRVTEAQRNVLTQVQVGEGNEDMTPLEALQEIVESLDPADRQLVQSSLFMGIACNPFQLELKPGDFLVRNLLGVDPRTGAIAVGDRVRPGQRIQFHLRDAHTSAEDLEILLKQYRQENQDAVATGALMFSCLGRGENLYDEPNFDSDLFRQYLGEIPLGGFFCNGEIGPIGGNTYLHGYTSVFGIFCQPEAKT